MSFFLFLLWLVSIPYAINALHAAKEYAINCGALESITDNDIEWITDEGFIHVGEKSTIHTPGLMPILATLRHFPDKSARKYCYDIPVIKGEKYMVRTSYYYGSFDGGKVPPVFDQIIDGTKWGTVNTTEDYANGLTSYYEIIVAASGGKLSFCVARNELTASDPFISALEVIALNSALYNPTDFRRKSLVTVARNSFGNGTEPIRFPDDQFNRYWHPFMDNNLEVLCHSNVTSTRFWNLPPKEVFRHALTANRRNTLEIEWPPGELAPGTYYIALYFQDSREVCPYSWRVFDVFINGKIFYKALNATAAGVTVFGTEWPLSGKTKITLVPDAKATVGPIINAGEILQILPLGQRTVARDVKALEKISRSLKNPPPDWSGDPCLPIGNEWTGVKCAIGKSAAISALNLTGLGLTGELSPKINRLAALTSIQLGGNKLTGPIPDMSGLKKLVSLNLENNQFTGPIPPSLSKLPSLQQLSIQKNKLDGPVPDLLKNKLGLKIQF